MKKVRRKKNDETTILCRELIAALEKQQDSLTNVCLRCYRLAKLLGKTEAAKYFSNQLSGFRIGTTKKTLERYERVWIQHTFPGMEDYVTEETTSLITQPLETVESMVKKGNLEYSNFLTVLRKVIHAWLVDTLITLRTRDVTIMIFRDVRKKVSDVLSKISPEIRKIFASIDDYLQSQNPTDISNAALSCRRILQILADTVCPPKTHAINGNKHPKGKEKYKNRLFEFSKDKTKSNTFKKNLKANLDYYDTLIKCFDRRINITYDWTHKGKKEIRLEEAKRIVIYTYLLVYDIISLMDENDIGEIISRRIKTKPHIAARKNQTK